MGWLRSNLLALSLVVFVVTATVLLAVVGYAGAVAYLAVQAGETIVPVLLDLAVPYLPIVAGLLVFCALSGLGVVAGTVDRASKLSMPRSDRLGSVAERIERAYPTLEPLGLPESVSPPEPTAEERAERALADLKTQYVNGDIDEVEFERKLDRLVSNDSIDDVRAARERERTLERA